MDYGRAIQTMSAELAGKWFNNYMDGAMIPYHGLGMREVADTIATIFDSPRDCVYEELSKMTEEFFEDRKIMHYKRFEK